MKSKPGYMWRMSFWELGDLELFFWGARGTKFDKKGLSMARVLDYRGNLGYMWSLLGLPCLDYLAAGANRTKKILLITKPVALVLIKEVLPHFRQFPDLIIKKAIKI